MPGRHTNRRHIGLTLIIIGLTGIVVAAWLTLNHLSPQPTAISVEQKPSTDKPSSDAIASYSVPANQPKFIAIPSIQIPKTRVTSLGLLPNNQIASPRNIYDAGWYQNSAKPGSPGAVFIYGHTTNDGPKGVFFNLKDLRPNDKITITTGNNATYTYQVVKSQTYPHDKVDINAVLSPISGDKGLNLMTCTGEVIKGSEDFSERLVVFATLLEGM